MSFPEAPELSGAGLREQAGAVASGAASSVALVAAALERIAAAQSTINAFRCVRFEAAMEEAAAADRRAEAGERPPLLGVPVAIKDDMDLAGESSPFGCAGDFEPKAQDGEVARRLRAAGAVIVGKTNTPEVGQWPFTEGAAFGITRNPWHLDHTPGGSSGGSAAAVAASLVAGAVGSDGAGSVRIPAAWTNLVGIKPQRGRVSTWPEPEMFHGLTCFGPLARTVADAALLLDVLSGPHPSDVHRPPPPTEPYAAVAARGDPGRPLRIALSLRIPFSGAPARLHPEIRAAVRRIADVLSGLGHAVVEADPRYGLVGASLPPRGLAGLRTWTRCVPDAALLDPRTRSAARTGRILGGPILRLARAVERPFARRIGAIFGEFDAILVPTTAQPPPPVGHFDGLTGWKTDRAMVAACPYAWPWNVLGWPSLSVPAGFTSSGLPIGAMLHGPANAEAILIAMAAQLESVERWDRRTPLSARPRQDSNLRPAD